jgi:hypothetical protein
MQNLVLIANVEQHPFMLDYLHEFQSAFAEAFPDAVVHPGRGIRFKRQFFRLFRHTYRYLPFRRIGLPESLRRGSSFSAICGNDFAYCMPSSFVGKNNYLYVFDAWPRDNQVLVDCVRLFAIRKVFFSALQSTENFNRAFQKKGAKGVWVPEGIYAQNYTAHPYADKNIDVIQFGRRYEKYYARIVPALEAANRVHYDKRGGELNEPLSRAKISICFPSSLTHPERSEYISTMTLRYLQSIVSKCLIVGSLPYDMRRLFDYNPVVEADLNNPEDQILDILRNFPDYIPLIEKNYASVIAQHQWSSRMETIRQHLQQ